MQRVLVGALVVVVLAVLGSGTAYFVWTSRQTTSTTCAVQVPPPQGIYLRVVSDAGGAPIPGLPVTIQYEEDLSCDPHNANLTTSVAVTNSSGWMLFQNGYPWYFAFTYSGHGYNFTINSSPLAWSSATISVPSGKLTIQICGLGGGSPDSACQPEATTTIGP